MPARIRRISSTKKLASEDYADMITTHDHADYASAGDDTDNDTTEAELREIDSLQRDLTWFRVGWANPCESVRIRLNVVRFGFVYADMNNG
ncbi:hypothetical protein PR002_g10556 [Phytophthora rubi]|uniref:Uncharacterized protein n=1 Tax=Phytophthora rubi TaxID=129364 RepID=A0A6A3M6R2_9STRA|nr:hypothetical protein PR002_g10556 [Phytophthora rubi]